MSGKLLARASALSLTFLLAACGGDDSSTPLVGGPNQPGNGDTSGTENVGSLVLSASPVQMGTSNDSRSEIIAFVKDRNNALMREVPVSFRVNDSGAALAFAEVETNENGRAENVLTTPANARNRAATVTASAGGAGSSISINISGTTLSITGPSSIAANTSAPYTVLLQDSENLGVQGERIQISNTNATNSIEFASASTTDDGEVSFRFNAASIGEDTITVTAFSGESTLTATQNIVVSDSTFMLSGPDSNEININSQTPVTLEWNENGTAIAGQPVSFNLSRGDITSAPTAITDANGRATIQIRSSTAGPATIVANAINPETGLKITTQREFEFIASIPASVTLQADRTQLGGSESSKLTAVVRDADGNLVKNQDVSFSIIEDVSSGSLTPPAATTNSLGRASATFRAGPSPTGRNQVVVAATTGGITQRRELTVSGGASRITVGTGNQIEEPDSDHYLKRWSVFASDVNGRPASNVHIELSVLPVSYGKGFYVQVDTDGDGEPDQWAPNRTITCPSEDINRNGFLDPDELDVNGNGRLDPTNDAVVTSSTNLTDEEGAVHFEIVYPQSNCSWTDVLIEARASVDGTEFSESALVTLSCSAPDLTDLDVLPPSIQGGSKYGKTARCDVSFEDEQND